MIKLVITSDFEQQPITRCFEYSPIIIGGLNSTIADLKLDGPSIEERHLQISSQKSETKTTFFAHNLANDPFSTLNGLPFGKQPIANNDLLQIGDISIRFEIENVSEVRDLPVAPLAPATMPVKEEKTVAVDPPAPIAVLPQEDTETLAVKKPVVVKKPDAAQGERHFSQLKLSESTFNAAFPYTNPQPTSSLGTMQKPVSFLSPQAAQPKLSLKDYYLSEYDEEGENSDTVKESATKGRIAVQFSKRWRFFLIIFSSITMTLATAACLAFLWVSDQSGEEEIKAARGVADVAMALTYAQLKNIQPPNQNWSHHEFLRSSLHAVMAPNYRPLAECDSHGQFANCLYMLRIHTNADSSQFLVIAQPAPSLLHWVIPKATIVVDSRTMETRRIKDIKALNRLIVNTNTPEANSGGEMSALVSEGTLIPLAALADEEDNQGFITPRELGVVRPGAENLIYNAPRYYMLGEMILETALNIEKHGNGGDVVLLHQELNALMKYPNLVLYSTQGIQNTVSAQKALAVLAPQDKFLVASLQLSPAGKIASAQLLSDVPVDISEAEKIQQHTEAQMPSAIPEATVETVVIDSLMENATAKEQTEEAKNSTHIDVDDPLYLHLKAIALARQQVLYPICNDISELMHAETQMVQPDFINRCAKLQQKYLAADQEQQVKLEKKFEEINNEQVHLPALTLLNFIKAAGLEIAFQSYLKKLSEHPSTRQITDEKVFEQIKFIERSATWPELDVAANQINRLLRFQNIPNEERLTAFQNNARLVVTQKLNQFILSSDLTSNNFSPDYLQSLSNILRNSWIVDPETYDFYIDEFELREPQEQKDEG